MGEPGAAQGGTGQVRTGQVETGQVCTSQFRTVQVRTGQVKTSQAGQVLLGTRVWPYSVLLVLDISQKIFIISPALSSKYLRLVRNRLKGFTSKVVYCQINKHFQPF